MAQLSYFPCTGTGRDFKLALSLDVNTLQRILLELMMLNLMLNIVKAQEFQILTLLGLIFVLGLLCTWLD